MSSLILLAALCVESLRIGEWTSVFDKLEGPAAIAQHPDGGIVIADRLAGSIDRSGDGWCRIGVGTGGSWIGVQSAGQGVQKCVCVCV